MGFDLLEGGALLLRLSMTCNDCSFFSHRNNQCRRNAPTHPVDGRRFPDSHPLGWCGQFEEDTELTRNRALQRNPDEALESYGVQGDEARLKGLRRIVRAQAKKAIAMRVGR
jgi:hypothetical protein